MFLLQNYTRGILLGAGWTHDQPEPIRFFLPCKLGTGLQRQAMRLRCIWIEGLVDPCAEETFHPRVKSSRGGKIFSRKVKQKAWCVMAQFLMIALGRQKQVYTHAHAHERKGEVTQAHSTKQREEIRKTIASILKDLLLPDSTHSGCPDVCDSTRNRSYEL